MSRTRRTRPPERPELPRPPEPLCMRMRGDVLRAMGYTWMTEAQVRHATVQICTPTWLAYWLADLLEDGAVEWRDIGHRRHWRRVER